MKQRKIYVVLFSIIALVLCGNVSMGQVVKEDSIVSKDYFNPKDLRNDFVNPKDLTKISKDTKPKEITILIEDKTADLKLQIRAQLTAGSIYFEIYDPSGKKRDGLSFTWNVKGESVYIQDKIPGAISGIWAIKDKPRDSFGEDKIVDGIIAACYRNPMPGKWIIKVSPKQAEGNYIISPILKR